MRGQKVKKTKKVKKLAKPKVPKVDGLGPKDVAKIRSAIRQVWHRSHPRKLAQQRAVGKDGFFRCEGCKKKTPKVCIDHKIAVGDVDGGFLKRLFCPSKDLQALCVSCHNKKTKQEREAKAIERLIGL
jgi:hypothetical protein